VGSPAGCDCDCENCESARNGSKERRLPIGVPIGTETDSNRIAGSTCFTVTVTVTVTGLPKGLVAIQLRAIATQV